MNAPNTDWTAFIAILITVFGGQATAILFVMNAFSRIRERLTKIETILKMDYDTNDNIPMHKRGR